jgi:hypothetical protein
MTTALKIMLGKNILIFITRFTGPRGKRPSSQHSILKEQHMKKTIIKLTLAAFFLITGGATPVLADGGGGLPPLCYPRACLPIR